MKADIFKAYDIRGKYPGEINEGAAADVSEALARFFKRGKIVIAHDARLSSPALYNAVIKPLSNKVIKAGMTTTPMFYFLVNKLKAAGGIMITASHNPKEYNGLKVVGKGAVPVSGKEIWRLIRKNDRTGKK